VCSSDLPKTPKPLVSQARMNSFEINLFIIVIYN